MGTTLEYVGYVYKPTWQCQNSGNDYYDDDEDVCGDDENVVMCAFLNILVIHDWNHYIRSARNPERSTVNFDG